MQRILVSWFHGFKFPVKSHVLPLFFSAFLLFLAKLLKKEHFFSAAPGDIKEAQKYSNSVICLLSRVLVPKLPKPFYKKELNGEYHKDFLPRNIK